jgi:predicted RNA binding protein YcfA (HicA-like mRNA interferase family)
MEKLPTQLTWRKFVRVLEALGYAPMKSKRGAARSFHNPQRNPPVVTFHEPHGGDTIRQGTLTDYLNKLNLERDKFMELIQDTRLVEQTDVPLDTCCICHEDITLEHEKVTHKENGLPVHSECHSRVFPA